MVALSTHDTKRSADVRARLALLSEVPGAWAEACGRWMDGVRPPLAGRRSRPPRPAPAVPDLVGAWPLPADRAVALHGQGDPGGQAAHVVAGAGPGLRRGARRLGGGHRDRRRDRGGRRRVRGAAGRARPGQRPGPDGCCSWRSRACPTRTRAPSCGTSASSTPTTGGRSTSRCGGPCWPSCRRARGPTRRRSWPGPTRGCPSWRWCGRASTCAAGGRPRSGRGRPGPTSRWRSSGPAAAHGVGLTRGGAVAVVVPRLVLGLADRGGWEDTTVTLPPGDWADVVTGASVAGGPVAVGDLVAAVPGGRTGALAVMVGVWAPRASRTLEVVRGDGRRTPLAATERGHWAGEVPDLGPGGDYGFSLDGGPVRPDPRSPVPAARGGRACRGSSTTGPSPGPTAAGAGSTWRGSVLYELHVGTFSPEGTFDGAVARLDHLVDLGVDAIELMPVAAFPGRPRLGLRRRRTCARRTRAYGGPDGLRRLVDACHARGLGVILDVVYNHLGPAGNYLGEFGPYFTDGPPDHLGPGPQPRRAGQRRGAGLRGRQRPHVAAGLPPRRAAARRGARHRRRVGRPRPRAAVDRGGRPGGRGWAGRCG